MKRPLAHRLFSAWLALLVLTASVGLTVQQHTCRVSGQQTASVIFAPAHHGCPAPISKASAHGTSHAKVKSSCCDFGTHFHKLDAPSPELTWVKTLVPLFVSVWVTNTEWPRVPTAPLLKGTADWYASDTSPPIRAGRTLLTFVCTLIV